MNGPRSVARFLPQTIALVGLVLALVAPSRLRADDTSSAPQASSPEARPPSVADLIKQGNEARRAGQMREAIASFRRARDLAPQAYEIRALLADTLRRTGQLDRALPEYEAARRIDPTRPEGYTGPALIARQRYDFERAAALLQEGLAMVADASKPDLLLVLAETKRRQGRLEEAERLFERVQAVRPGESPAQAGLARVAEDRGDLAGAIRAWDVYLEIKPDDDAAALRREELRELRASIEALRETAARGGDARVLTEQGRLQWVAGDSKGAVDSYRRALRSADSTDARRGLALSLRDSGQEGGVEAAREFRRILKKEPGDGLALYNLVAIAAAGPSGEEEGAWRAVMSARPDDLFALRGYVECLDRQEPATRARLIERALADGRAAATPALLRRRALLLATAGRSQEAAEALDRLLLPDPTDPWNLEVANEVLFLDPGILALVAEREKNPSSPASTEGEVLKARLAWWSGHGEEALGLLRRTVEAHPESGVARSALGEAYQSIAHAPELALPELERAVELEPERPAAHVDLALALLRAGRPKEAAEAARRGLEGAPGFAPALSILGAALSDQGDFEGAVTAYAAALAADPADNFGLARGQLPLALAALGRNVEARRALRGPMPTLPEMLYLEAWTFTRDARRDRGFRDPDWGTWRTRFRGTLASESDAYRAVSSMLSSLGEPYTRLRDPEETAALYLARRGSSVATDPLGRVSTPSRTVITGELPGGLGYIRLSNFTDPNVVAEVRAALEKMRLKEGIVLDLRGNTGGLARSADRIGDLLVGPGKEAGVDASGSGPSTQVTGGDGAVTDSPITVLVDGQTGSAAERLARTLSAASRASLSGDATFGKGKAQVSRVLPGGTTVLVSISEMLGPDGKPIQGRGLQPTRKMRLPPPGSASSSPTPAPGPSPSPTPAPP